LCRSVFSLEIKDVYSTEEIGYIALQSPASEQLLVQSESVLVEIIDDKGRPCPPGKIGRVIVTPIHAFAMPLLRFELGDLAEVGGPAACGRTLPVIERVIGRMRHMLRLPTGETFYPALIYMLEGITKIIQFQIVRKAVNLLEMRMVVRAPLDEAEEILLRDRIRERFSYPFEVRFAYVDEIPRAPSGKFFDFYSEID
jgi:phenylacetate-CoA ligase